MKSVVVTGAYGGMGRAATLALRDAGYRVFALDRSVSDPEDGIIPIRADITSGEDVERAVGVIGEQTDSIYAVLHFAGIYMLDSLVEMNEDAFVRAFDVNVFGAYRINKALLPLLRTGSRIVLTTSELAPLDPLPFTGLYAITKSTLEKYAYSLRMELQLLGISVSVIRPGAVKTDMLGVSTSALDKFCDSTEHYSCNATRFKKIVDSVESRCVAPERVARVALRAIKAKRPKYVYKLNRNPLLLLLGILPKSVQTGIIRIILK